MKHSSNNRSGLFLLEIIIAILFFAIVSAVCLRAFAKSHTLSQQASDTDYAISNMENIAELLKSIDSKDLKDDDVITKTFQSVYPKSSFQDDSWNFYFDSDWKTCKAGNASYQIIVLPKDTEDSNSSSSIQTFELITGKTSDSSTIEQLTLKLHAKE